MTTTADAAPNAPPHGETTEPRYAEVVVDARTGKTGDTFTYSVPPQMRLRVGHLVCVPFGPRTLNGVVTGLRDTPNVDYTRPIASLVEEQPLLTPERIELGRWLADYYRAPAFDAFAPMLPPGMRGSAQTYVQAVASPPPGIEERLPKGAQRLLAYLRANPGTHRTASLTATLGPWVRNATRALIKTGAASEHTREPQQSTSTSAPRLRYLLPAVPPSMLRKRAGGYRGFVSTQAMLLRTLAKSPAGINAAAARKRYSAVVVRKVVREGLASLHALDDGTQILAPVLTAPELHQRAETYPRRPNPRAMLLRALASAPQGGLEATVARKRYGAASVRDIVTASLASLAAELPAQEQRPALLPVDDQQHAIKAIVDTLDSSTEHPRVWLLHGVTGSGKTEVYMRAIAHCLSQRRSAIMLVPEVALTTQTTQRFELRFPQQAIVLHSNQTPAQQQEAWWRIFRGERSVVVGPRSALFAPVEDLGLIVLDEEHEWTYKQSDAQPHYHARETAEQLASLTGAVVVLGSATPDIVTAWRATQGLIGKLSMPARIERSGAATSLAEVDVVDMRTELREGNRSIFSRLLQERLQDTIAAGRQAVLFLNRRGAASVVACRSCGFVVRCPRCSTPLTYHRPFDGAGAGRLRCHHCGRGRAEPGRCPRCRSIHIRYLGLGTQRVVDEVGRIAPDARVLRWDSDTASTTGAHERLLRSFAEGEADVLVGTQMVAKGLDVPSVDLVGAVLADIGIHMPDFRAPERTFQLLTQVAGRAGRGPRAGYAVIQTYLPDHYAIQAAAEQDYTAFYSTEMEHRRAQGSPPFSRLVRLLYDGHSDRHTAQNEARQLAGRLRRTVHEWDMRGVDVIGPAPTYPPRIRNAWRWQLLIRAPEPRLLLDKLSIPSAWRVDVDPVNIV